MERENKGIEVELLMPFNVVRETLERMGVGVKKDKTLYPTCYVLQKKGKYYIINFKNLFRLDGKGAHNYTEDDELRQSAIAKLLEDWGFVDIIDNDNFVSCDQYPTIFVLPKRLKNEWTIAHKYSIGSKKKGYADDV